MLADKQMKCEEGSGLGSRVQQILIFLEKMKNPTCDGCIIKIYIRFTKNVFLIFLPFFARLAIKFLKSANMTHVKKIGEKFKKVSKDVEFHADFKSFEKGLKMYKKKCYK